jgi:hypothetical protein
MKMKEKEKETKNSGVEEGEAFNDGIIPRLFPSWKNSSTLLASTRHSPV